MHGKSLLFELSQRHHTTCITINDWSLLLSLHSLQFYPSLRGSHGVFLSDLFRVKHDNAFLCPCCTCLSHIVSDSDVCTSVSVSCSRSCPLISAGFRSCGVPLGSILLSRFCHTLDLLSCACFTHCTVARGRPRLCSRSDLLQDLVGLLCCQHGP